jgi:hypothetical protein
MPVERGLRLRPVYQVGERTGPNSSRLVFYGIRGSTAGMSLLLAQATEGKLLLIPPDGSSNALTQESPSGLSRTPQPEWV